MICQVSCVTGLNGIKGEMPKFGQKLSDADMQALIAFIRSLKE